MEIKQFADIQLGNRYVKVFVEPDVNEKVATKALNKFIEKFKGDEILDENGTPASKGEPMDFLIIQKDGITCSHKNNNNQEPHCIWFKDLQLCEVTETVGCENLLDKYKVEIPYIQDFYTVSINDEETGKKIKDTLEKIK